MNKINPLQNAAFRDAVPRQSFILQTGIVLLFIISLLTVSSAQTATSGQISGNITDQSGAAQHIIHPFSLRNTFKFEMEHLLYRVGFLVEQVYADFDRTPFGSKYPGELIFVSRKVA